MSREQVEDPAHWFTQSQINRFHEALAEKQATQRVSRGRPVCASQGIRRPETVRHEFLSALLARTAFWKDHTPSDQKRGIPDHETGFQEGGNFLHSCAGCEGESSHVKPMGQLEAITKVFTTSSRRSSTPAVAQGCGHLPVRDHMDEAPPIPGKGSPGIGMFVGFALALVFSFFLPFCTKRF